MTANAMVEDLEEDPPRPTTCTWKYCTTCNPPAAQSPAVAAAEATINQAWALADGRTLDAYDAAIARVDAELARVAQLKAVR